MQFTLSLALAATAFTASVAATPSGCSTSYNGDFQITVVKPTSKRNLITRDTTCGQEGYLTLKLHDGNLIDSKGRTGYIASNYQFQFDGPPQENAASVGGYSACQNGSLALADSTIFYQCLSGDFYNLYDRYWAAQCQPIHIDILPCVSGATPKGVSPPGSPVSQIGDGQPQAPSATSRVPISQIPDGQPQAPTATPRAPISQIPDGQPQAPTGHPAPPAPPVTQISDGQPQAPTAPPAPHGPPAPPAPHGSPAPAPPAPPAPSSPVGQISDGQPQVSTSLPHNATMTASPTKFPVTPTSFVSSSTSTVSKTTATPTAVSASSKLNTVSSLGIFAIAAAASALFF